ncbi:MULTISPECIES: lasso peptide isopeptide bond-forming cyclase [Bacillus]|uniref:lasso peptide isopeptide bond-forming cyclase n=1 Tax=Bacillus TaxID=1386 RepID=UPI00032D7FB7|nr:asparagine synthase (glutamine-hydrolyzing) [Bacillus cereus BAG2O-3]EOQ10445.1 asparagine synthase (glutamine-hydrolyzing) [Bacillus cereus B5-2]EOQ29392.1 asparagine synthase (glutamine-hydrolyzing) [Bacillus cereus BAG3O-1]MBJ8116359.1 lasso peptide isopeptide bond-forming cyclase [Bacillus cereus]PFW82327.1 asparagine synthetase B [Bacillus sp. AFS075960]RFB16038.1 lasso peptide isopeptide bond-forming cyclase [Bacillus sp. OE]RFB23419.1 lasso peptide isopeptide bond-forming cyclase [B
MSAITGIIHFNNEPVSIEHGTRLMSDLQRYPADDIQIWHKENAFLGCHAQWITPESVGEQLPFYNYEKQLAITADAIIDNRDELFEKLQVDYSDRKNMTDSELILLSYQKWEEAAPKYLVGDFAFMIWDEKKQILFGARDFSGSRTLYIYRDEEKFSFCTLIKPLFTLPYVDKKLNEQWLAEFLAIPVNFESVDPQLTVYKYIEQVPPSHTILVKDGKVKISRYYTPTAGKMLNLKSNEEYEEAFREVYQRAVKVRLRTHHQVGAHLSGGLDSGSVVSFAAKDLRAENKKLHTFSYVPAEGFKDWTHKGRIADERPFIQSTVQYVGNIQDYYLELPERSPLSEIDDWLETMEMPYKFFENTFWLRGVYEKASQRDIGVLLSGQRGNWTVSWGPIFDYQAMLLKKLHWIRFYRELYLYSRNIGVKKARVFEVVRRKAFPFLHQLLSSEEQDAFPIIINPEFAKKMNVFDRLKEQDVDITGTFISNAYDMKREQFEKPYYWSINGTYETKLSLRYALWDRDPTNDLRIIQFCLSVPEEQYVQNGLDRSLIRRATKNFLPDKVRLNQRVRGVQGADGVYRMTPFWNEFIEEVQELSVDPIISEFLNVEVIKKAISKICKEPRPEYAFDLDFRILMRSLIFYRFIKNLI